MRSELSSLDLHFLVKEFQSLINGKIDKIYQDKNKVIFQIHVPSKGKKYLKIILPSFIFVSDKKDIEGESDNFALSLRKHITSSRIRSIQQIDFERILKLELETKNGKYFLYFELFKPGNIILYSENRIILAKKYKAFGSRLIRPGIEYDLPKKKFDLLESDLDELKKIIHKSKRRSIVITLAVDLGLGGLYAEELLYRSKLNKNKDELSSQEIEELYKNLRKLKKSASLYPDTFSSLKLKSANRKPKTYSTLSKLLDDIIKPKKSDKYKEITKYRGIITKQENQISGLEKSYSENQRKAELIYEKYTKVKEILDEAKENPKKYKINPDKSISVELE